MHASASSTPSELRAILAELGLPAPEAARSPHRVLERMLNLPRCVELVHVLDRHAGPATGPTGGATRELSEEPAEESRGEPADGAELARLRLAEGMLLGRLTSLRAQTSRRFDSALTGLRPAPDAGGVHVRLLDQGALKPGAVAARERLAQRLAARYAAVTRGALTIVFKELALLRHDLHATVQQCGRRSVELCELDQLFDGMFRAELEQACAQLEQALTRQLQVTLLRKLSALSPDCSVGDLQPWFSADGCVGVFLRDSARLVHSVLELEWSPLMGLIKGARGALGQARGGVLYGEEGP